MRLSIISSALLMMTISVGVQAKMYKWTDAKGVTHYSQHKPKAGVSAEELTLRGHKASSKLESRSINTDEAKDEKSKKPAAKSNKVDKENAEIEKKNAKIKAQNCKNQKANLASLDKGGRIYETGADGERIYLNEEQINEKRDSINQSIEQNCAS